MTGGNILPVLAADVLRLHREAVGLEREAAAKALQCGRKLNEAKATVQHGGWADWLATTGIGERTAQRYMRLDRCALNSDTVADLGGIRAASEWLAPVRLPDKGQVLLISTDGFDPDGDDVAAFVWRHGKGFHVAMVDLRPEWPQVKKTKRAIPADMGETLVWLTLWIACKWRLPEMSFSTAGHPEVKSLIEMIEGFCEGPEAAL